MADASLPAMLLRLAISMGVVIGLMLLAARVLRRATSSRGIGGGRVRRTPINVEAMQPLTKAAHVAVVRAAGRELVLGVTDHQVTLLHSAIEPRDSLVDLDVGDGAHPLTSTQTTELDVESLLDHHDHALPASTRIVPAASGSSSVSSASTADATTSTGPSAWMDALELLREKTVRR